MLRLRKIPPYMSRVPGTRRISEVVDFGSTTSIFQEAFINSIPVHFNLMGALPLLTPLPPSTQLSIADYPTTRRNGRFGYLTLQGLVGALEWPALGTRSDIAFATTRSHVSATTQAAFIGKPPSAYCSTPRELGGGVSHLVGNGADTDADGASDHNDRRTIDAYIVKIGDGAVSWKSKK